MASSSAENLHASRLARIQAKLGSLSKAGLVAPGPPVPSATIEAFEAAAGITVPTQLRSFAIEIGLGGTGPAGGLHGPERWLEAIFDPIPGILAMPCPLDPSRGFGDYDEVEDPAQGAMAIASEGAGAPYTLLVVSGPNRGKLVRYELDSQWCEGIERASPPGPAYFFDWYEAWLDWSTLGVLPTFYGVGLLGSERELVAVLADESQPEPRKHRALVSLTQLPRLDERSVEVIRDVYERALPALRAAVLPVVVEHSADPATTLYEALDAAEPELRYAALREVKRRKPPGALEHLARASDDIDDRIADAALLAIENTPHLDLARLTRLFERPALRQRVVSNLGKLATADALPLLARGLEDPNAHVRRISAFSTAAIGLAPAASAQRS